MLSHSSETIKYIIAVVAQISRIPEETSRKMIPSKEIVQRPTKNGCSGGPWSEGNYSMKSKNGCLVSSSSTANNADTETHHVIYRGSPLKKVYDSRSPPAAPSSSSFMTTRRATNNKTGSRNIMDDDGIRVRSGGGSGDGGKTVVSQPHQRHGVKQNGGHYQLKAKNGRLRGPQNCTKLS